MVFKHIVYSGQLSVSTPTEIPVIIIGHLNLLKNSVPFDAVKGKFGGLISAELYKAAVGNLSPSATSDVIPLYLNKVVVAALPTKCSRHNTPAHPHALYDVLKNWGHSAPPGIDIHVVIICYPQDVISLGPAAARAFPLVNAKIGCVFSDIRSAPSCKEAGEGRVVVEFLVVPNKSAPEDFAVERTISLKALETVTNLSNGIRLAAHIVDTPPNIMTTGQLVRESQQIAHQVNAEILIIKGDELRDKGLGALYAVGKGSQEPPYLVVLSYKPKAVEGKTVKKIAWVGKGVTFNTGGLCVKTPKTAMCGMKRDCAGAAAVLGAFQTVVRSGFEHELHAVLCIAENSIGAASMRPDDIVTSYSGRSIEVKNTDAEGLLVLADGVAYAQKDLKCDVIIDMATLSAAQGTTTGRHHGAVITNNECWEFLTYWIGKITGDLNFPVVFAPELYFNELNSAVADMTNSPANVNNALTSCAGLFIQSHLGFDWPGVWMHIDITTPAHDGERATGYGVALLTGVVSSWCESPLLRNLTEVAKYADKAFLIATPDFTGPLTREAGLNVPK